MARPKKGDECGARPTANAVPATRALVPLAARRAPHEAKVARRVGPRTAANHPRSAAHRAELTPFGHAIEVACEAARRVRTWPKMTKTQKTEAARKASLMKSEGRIVFVDAMGRVGVGKVVAKRTGRGDRPDLLVFRRLYKKSVENCRGDYVALPTARIVAP